MVLICIFFNTTFKISYKSLNIFTNHLSEQVFYYNTYKFVFLWVSMENHEVLVILKEITIHMYEIECLP